MTPEHSGAWLGTAEYPPCDVTRPGTAVSYAALMAGISLVTGTRTRFEDPAAWGGPDAITSGPGAGFYTRRRPAWVPAEWARAYAEIASAHRVARAEIAQHVERFEVMEQHRHDAAEAAFLLARGAA